MQSLKLLSSTEQFDASPDRDQRENLEPVKIAQLYAPSLEFSMMARLPSMVPDDVLMSEPLTYGWGVYYKSQRVKRGGFLGLLLALFGRKPSS
jgi:hypothetical protein